MAPLKGFVDLLGFIGDVGPPLWDETTLANLRASGVGLFNLTSALPFQDWATTLETHCRIRDQLIARDNLFRLVLTKADLTEAARTERIGVILGLQEPGFVEDRLSRLERLHSEGLRIIQVAYQQRNQFGSGFLAWQNDPGLSSLGREYISAVHRAGLILDLSHLAPKTALDCAQEAPGPVMISHTGAQGAYPHHRGTPDEVFEALAKRENSLVGLYAMTFFLGEEGKLFEKNFPEPSKTSKAGFGQTATSLEERGPDQDTTNLMEHIQHAARLIGPEKVALGTDGPVGGFTDINGAEKAFREVMQPLLDPEGQLKSRWPTHLPLLGENPEGFTRLTRELAAHFSNEEITGILGDNAWRFFERNLR